MVEDIFFAKDTLCTMHKIVKKIAVVERRDETRREVYFPGYVCICYMPKYPIWGQYTSFHSSNEAAWPKKKTQEGILSIVQITYNVSTIFLFPYIKFIETLIWYKIEALLS